MQSGLEADISAEVRTASGQIVDLLRSAKRVHLDLERRLVGVLARRRRLRLLALGDELFTPTLALSAPDAGQVAEVFANRALGVNVPRLIRFDDLVDALWAPPQVRETPEAKFEDAGDDADVEDVQRYPDAVLAAARGVLAATRAAPTGLSALLDAAAGVDPSTVGGAVDEVVELVLLGSQWAFAPDIADADEEAGDGRRVPRNW